MYLVVLNDGETYTDLDGCEVLWIDDDDSTLPEDFTDEMDEWVAQNYGTGIPVGELLEAFDNLDPSGEDEDRLDYFLNHKKD